MNSTAKSDIELMEAAARAAGLIVNGATAPGEPRRLLLGNPLDRVEYNPLTDSGQCFDLHVAINATVSSSRAAGKSTCALSHTTVWVEVMHEEDPEAATRRAVVLAAAEWWRRSQS